MEQAKATPTSSAAAVATASSDKSGTSGTSVKLLIKASNQQYDDQIIESDLLWTVKSLKTHLSLVYPNKPPVAEQKLIYSGQLLNDALQLKDVIRSYKDVYTHNHIFHLVYTPKQAPPQIPKPKMTPATSTHAAGSNASNNNMNADGLRQRHAGQQQQQHQAQSQQQQQQYAQMPTQYAHLQYTPQMLAAQFAQCPQYDPNNPLMQSSSSSSSNTNMPFSLPGQFNMQALATQQAVMYNWMQQVYSQYMDQCVRFSNNAATAASPATPNSTVPVPPLNPFLQQLPFMLPNVAAATTPVIHSATASTTLQQQQQQPQQVAPVATNIAGVDDPQQQQQPQQLQEEQRVAAPRFPNIVQDEQENRDWLDNFFSITRLAIFLTILYFNASPLRCLVVVIIAGVIYLYHIGVFRLRHERNNNNINRNNNAAADQIRQGVAQVQQAQAAQQQEQQDPEVQAEQEQAAAAANPPHAADAVGAATDNVADDAAAENDNNSTSVISFVRTFIITFFTSLLPETPAL